MCAALCVTVVSFLFIFYFFDPFLKPVAVLALPHSNTGILPGQEQPLSQLGVLQKASPELGDNRCFSHTPTPPHTHPQKQPREEHPYAFTRGKGWGSLGGRAPARALIVGNQPKVGPQRQEKNPLGWRWQLTHPCRALPRAWQLGVQRGMSPAPWLADGGSCFSLPNDTRGTWVDAAKKKHHHDPAPQGKSRENTFGLGNNREAGSG